VRGQRCRLGWGTKWGDVANGWGFDIGEDSS
jgi:hypothetical protein